MSFIFTKTRVSVGFVLMASALLSVVGVRADPEPAYLDNRSTPQSLVESYYNAINLQQYQRASSYFSEGAGPKDFEAWAKGYATTQHVSVQFGETRADPGAGQIYWALPVALSVVSTKGAHIVYAGCYALHLTNPSMQTFGQYHPMSIDTAKLKKSSLPFEEAAPKSCD